MELDAAQTYLVGTYAEPETGVYASLAKYWTLENAELKYTWDACYLGFDGLFADRFQLKLIGKTQVTMGLRLFNNLPGIRIPAASGSRPHFRGQSRRRLHFENQILRSREPGHLYRSGQDLFAPGSLLSGSLPGSVLRHSPVSGRQGAY